MLLSLTIPKEAIHMLPQRSSSEKFLKFPTKSLRTTQQK